MKYDEQKLQRLRNRRAMLANEVKLLSEDVNEHRRFRNKCLDRIRELEKNADLETVYIVNGVEVGHSSNPKPRAKQELMEAEELLKAATQNLEDMQEQSNTMGLLVQRLEDAIVNDWHLKLPLDPRRNSPGLRRAGERV